MRSQSTHITDGRQMTDRRIVLAISRYARTCFAW